MNGIGPTINGEFFLGHISDEEETDTTFWKTNEFHKVKGIFFSNILGTFKSETTFVNET